MNMYSGSSVPARSRATTSAYRFSEAETGVWNRVASVIIVTVYAKGEDVAVTLACGTCFEGADHDVCYALGCDRISSAYCGIW